MKANTRCAFRIAAAALAAGMVGAAVYIILLLRSRVPGEEEPAPRSAEMAVVPNLGKPSWEEIDDPAEDGWDTEVFSERAGKQLKLLGKVLLDGGGIAPGRVSPFVAEGFECGPLRPPSLRTVIGAGPIRVERPDPLAAGVPARSGATGLAESLGELADPWRGDPEARFSVKIFRLAPEADSITTYQHAALSGRSGGSLIEMNAVWSARWTDVRGKSPRLVRLGVESFEQVTLHSSEPMLADCTAAVIGGNAAIGEQFGRGLNDWLGRIQDNRIFSLMGTPGLAAADVNGDRLDDLYVCQEGGLPNRLLIQEPDGAVRDASAGSGADWIDSTRSALLIDLDNDGDQDLAAAALGVLVLASGDGGGRFEIRAVLPTGDDTMSLAAADFDEDGDLDIYVCTYNRDDLVENSGVLSIDVSDEFVYHDAAGGGRNILYRNDTPRGGGWKFTDATAEAGLDAGNRRYSFAAAWEDFDGDGDVDLYVANDFGRNNLYRNDLRPGGRARFEDVAAAAGAEDRASGMSVSWGDYDRDGLPDVYIGNMFSAAGSRVTPQPRFKPEAAPVVKEWLQRFARGNTLLRNQGGAFEDRSLEAGVTMGRWAWSSNFADLDGDGWEDLLVANGYITTEDPGDL